MQFLRNLFSKLPAHEIAKTELEDCKRGLLQQQALAAYHTKMAEYYAEGIQRLSTYSSPESIRYFYGK